MRCLFIHPVFPGQFLKVMEDLATHPEHEVWHLSHQSAIRSLPGVRKFQYKFEPAAAPLSHPFLDKFSTSLYHGDAVARALLVLKNKGLVPDIICCYAGWGQGFYIKDIYPDVPVVGYFEWFLNAQGAEYNFDPQHPLDFDRQRLLRISNAGSLLDLQSFDAGVTPTLWQRQQFPQEFQSKLHCLHDGVDIQRFQPKRHASLKLADGYTLNPADTEVLTYSTRGMEPFRGFPQFMRALALVQQARPQCQTIIVGSDDNYYSRKTKDGRSYKEHMLEELSGRLDMARIHFTGWLQPDPYLEVLQASDAHVYMTYPYVLSWSMMEAMSTACLLIGSKTPPVQEMITHGENGLLADFFDHQQLAETIIQGLSYKGQEAGQKIRAKAREKIVQDYAWAQVTPRHIQLLEQLVKRR